MKVHWWNFQRNPTPNNDIIEKKRWCQSPSAAACHQQRNPQKHPTETIKTCQLKAHSPNWKDWKNLWTFSPWKSLRAQITQIKNLWTFCLLEISENTINHPTEKTVNFLSPWIHWKHNQSPNWKNYELCFAAFGLQRLEPKFPLWVAPQASRLFI